MEKSSPIGLVAGLVLIFGAIVMGDGWLTFLDPISAVLVFGGTAAALLITFTMAEMGRIPAITKAFFGYQAPDYGALAAQLSDFARTARRDGPLALDARLDEVSDPLLRAALEMAVDGVAPEQAEKMLRTRAAEATAGLALHVRFHNKAATYAPAFGMVGTLIGLIQMLQNLNDPAAIGPAMAIAMVTTFHGALLSNLIFLPMAGKGQGQIAATAKAHEMIRIGALGILAGEAPAALAQQLHLFAGGTAPAASPEPAPLRRVA